MQKGSQETERENLGSIFLQPAIRTLWQQAGNLLLPALRLAQLAATRKQDSNQGEGSLVLKVEGLYPILIFCKGTKTKPSAGGATLLMEKQKAETLMGGNQCPAHQRCLRSAGPVFASSKSVLVSLQPIRLLVLSSATPVTGSERVPVWSCSRVLSLPEARQLEATILYSMHSR